MTAIRPTGAEPIVKTNLSAAESFPHFENVLLSPSEVNRFFEQLTLKDRIATTYELFGDRLLFTTAGGWQSSVLPMLVQQAREEKGNAHIRELIDRTPFVMIDTGDLFPESVAYITELTRKLGIRLLLLKHALNQEEFSYNLNLLVQGGMEQQDAFDELTKIRPMKTYIRAMGIKVWISGNRRDQSPGRNGLPFVMEQNDLVKVFPLADQSRSDIAAFMREHNLPKHPLADQYRSIGNRSETMSVPEGAPYEKYGRHKGLKHECGLHAHWIADGKTMLRGKGSTFFAAERFPIQYVAA